MATLGQKISEFIVRGEAYFHKNVPTLFEDMDDGHPDAFDRLLFAYDLFMFLVELQALYNRWTEREILTMIDYYDSTYNLKALQGIIPDPYKSYQNATLISVVTNVVELPVGNGLLLKQGDSIGIYTNESEINSYYGLE